MFDIGIVTDEVDDDLETALRMAKEWGMRNVELRTIWGKGAWNLDSHETKEALSLLRAGGFGVAGIGCQFLKIPPENMKIEYGAQVENLRRSIEAAHIFGASLVRVLSPLFREGIEAPERVTRELVALYHLPIRLAERQGVTLAIENQSTTQIITSTDACDLTQQLGSDAFGILWDPANALAAGEADAFPAGYERVGPRLAHVHIKDTKRTESGEYSWCVVGEGEFDFAGQLERLHAKGYEGTVTLEPHLGSVEKVAASVENIRRAMEKLGG